MSKRTSFLPVRLSLADLVGPDYVEAVAAARSRLTGQAVAELRRLGRKKIDFFPRSFERALAAKLKRIGTPVTRPVRRSPAGAATAGFRRASRLGHAPLTGWGYYRVGEDGRLRFLLKSEHYHAPLGHAFPGYAVLEIARALGVPNATHNNTRGWITRRLEEELVRTANGIAPGDRAALAKLLGSHRHGALNRVLNLETGSLVCEAAIKMMLARFTPVQPGAPAPKYRGRTPVLVVIGDDEGGITANYHGTTVFAQMTRGMWPNLAASMEKARALKIVPVRPNDAAELERVFRRYDRRPFKIAGMLHELALMNYGGRMLAPAFIRSMYSFCRRHDVPTLCDEIQSCVWSPELYMFREYGIHPTFVSVGKGFPGGEYAASRLVFQAGMDCLSQFGALVTNGQEELASLAYLVTMRWAAANSEATRAIGDDYESRVRRLADHFPGLLSSVDGRRHLLGLRFHRLDDAQAFTRRMVDAGFDISVQSYKLDSPPVALTKLPIITGTQAVDVVLEKMAQALVRVANR